MKLSKPIVALAALLLAPPAATQAAEAPLPVKGLAVLPPHPWGVYTWLGSDKATWPADVPVKGIPLVWHWSNLEPRQGQYEFDSQVRARIEALKARGLYTHVKLWVAPDSPEWLYQLGVPRVEVPERTTPTRKQSKPVFPYYFSPVYKECFHRTIRALGDYIASLPADLKGRIVFVQSCEGSTGDGQPYKGEPVDPRYAISGKEWGKFRRETWVVYQQAFQRPDGSLRVPLLVNGDSNGPEENAWLLEHCDVFGLKQGMFSHGYLVSGAQERLANWEALRAAARAQGKQVFSRGEQDAEWNVCGWSKKNPVRAFYWSGLFALHCKLDIWNIPGQALATQPLGETVRFFNRYAGYDDPAGSPAAFCALRRGLDAADTKAFPEATFGEAKRKNPGRYLAIAKAFAPFGAKQGDPEKALGGGMTNRQADDQNDVGWGILPGNFERHLTQLQPEETSTGLWDVGPAQHPYGRFARRFDGASGRKVMRFQIADGFFENPAGPRAVRLRIVYLDQGKGLWALAYAGPQGEKVARTVELTGSGEWREIVEALPDAVWDHRLAGGGDLALKHVGGADAVFHLIELEKTSP